MSLSKEALTEINQKLQIALRTLIEENNRLHEESAFLRHQMQRLEAQTKQQQEQFGRLTRYMHALRDWLEKKETTTGIAKPRDK